MRNTLQDNVRDRLIWLTAGIRDENRRELAFAVSLTVTDHIFNLNRKGEA